MLQVYYYKLIAYFVSCEMQNYKSDSIFIFIKLTRFDGQQNLHCLVIDYLNYFY